MQNSGISKLHQNPPSYNPATIIVLGVARGGTSMVAKSLHLAGVPMNATTVTYEDIALGEALETQNTPLVEQLILERNRAHSVWGIKRPNMLDTLPQYLHLFRNPICVTVFRDILSTAKRNEISLNWSIVEGLKLAIHSNLQLVQFIQAHSIPNLLVSYEKAVQHPRTFVTALVEHCGISCDIEPIVNSIEADNPEYLGLV